MPRKQSPKRILLVEDNTVYAEALADLLEQENFTVNIAPNGVDGLLAAVKHTPDMILLDINMPEMDGLKTLKKIRSEPWGKGLPVVLLTASSDSANLHKAIEFGTTDYLIKDQWEAGEIITYVKRLLKRSAVPA